MRKISIIGSTGSIGTQTLDVIRNNPDFSVAALSCGKNINLLEEQIREFKPRLAAVESEEDAKELRSRLKDIDITIASGMEGLVAVAGCEECDTVVTAIVGMIGVRPTLAAIEAGKNIALANKETLVTAGHIIMPLAKERGVKILPVDSEHSAIFQALNGEDTGAVEKILLTCSGGPFRGFTWEQLEKVTPDDALRHPTWNMGKKITIDSASLANKGLEVMEVKWLYDVNPDRIQVVVQPQSIIHSMVRFADGSVMAQMAVPDMRLPIAYALSWPDRHPLPVDALDLLKVGSLHFEAPDTDRFPLLALAYEAGKAGGNQAAIVNGANEAANAAFRSGLIGFTDITRIVEKVVHSSSYEELNDIDALLRADRYGRSAAEAMIQGERKS